MLSSMPPMDRTSRIFGVPGDLSRNGLPPAGVAADLSQPSTPTEAAASAQASPARSFANSGWFMAILAGLAFLALNGES